MAPIVKLKRGPRGGTGTLLPIRFYWIMELSLEQKSLLYRFAIGVLKPFQSSPKCNADSAALNRF